MNVEEKRCENNIEHPKSLRQLEKYRPRLTKKELYNIIGNGVMLSCNQRGTMKILIDKINKKLQHPLWKSTAYNIGWPKTIKLQKS